MKYMYLDIETLGLNPTKEKIVAVGVGFDNRISVTFSENEQDLLFDSKSYIKSIVGGRRDVVMITFNGDAFDVRYLTTRGIVCRVDMSFLLDVMHVDFMWIMNKYMIGNRKQTLKLHEFADMCSIKYDDKVTGKGIPLLYENKLYEAIKLHCASDVKLLVQLSEIEEIKQLIKLDLKRRYKYVQIEESESL